MISAFEYVTVLISIILGLGITQILTGIADLVHQSKRVKIYGPHLLWVLIVLVLHVQEWWVTFDLRTFAPWRLPIFLFVMIYPIILFILARLLFPFGIQEGFIDLKEFYYENYKKIFLFGIVLSVLALLDSILIREEMKMDELLPKLVVPGVLLIVCLKRKLPEWAHYIISIGFLMALTLTIIIQWNEWLLS